MDVNGEIQLKEGFKFNKEKGEFEFLIIGIFCGVEYKVDLDGRVYDENSNYMESLITMNDEKFKQIVKYITEKIVRCIKN